MELAGSSRRQDVVVVGAGIAGLAAAVALAEAGAKVTVLERRPYVGGRAYSYQHPSLGEEIDSQHVLLGCCTNLVDLCQRCGAQGEIKWYDDITFLEPGISGKAARKSVIGPGGLPAPAHSAVSFLRAPMLSLKDKAGIARGLIDFMRGYPAGDDEAFSDWLRRTGQTERAVRHFWEPVVVGALNDGFERCSTKYAGQVFYESFLKTAEGGRLGIPRRPLSEFYGVVADAARGMGAQIELKCGADEMLRRDGGWVVRAGAQEFAAAAVVLASDLKASQKLMQGVGEMTDVEPFVVAPITTVHLWFDRPVTELEHAALLDTRIQWMFQKSKIRGWEPERGSYLELTISASWAELQQGREEILAAALEEAKMFFPEIAGATLVKSAVLKEARATFSVGPGMDQYRPAQSTGVPGLFVAGDWTATGWPATMEGAVRSGRLAAGAVSGEVGRFMTADLPARGLMGWLQRR